MIAGGSEFQVASATNYWNYKTHQHQSQRTLQLLALDPLSVVVVVVTSEVVAESRVDGAVVVESTIQNVRQCTAVRWN